MAVLALAVAATAIPHASARDDDLKHKQKQVERAVTRAGHDLDESSAAFRKATAKVEAAREQLATARGVLSAARAKVTAARLRDQEMQQRLEAAVTRLAVARTDLARGGARPPGTA